MIGGSRKGNVGNVASVVRWDAWAGLPGWLGEEYACAATARRRRAVRGAVVPGSLGYIRQGGGESGGVGGVPKLAASLHEFSSSDGGDLRNAAGRVYGQTGVLRVAAIGCAVVTRSGKPSDPLRIALLRPGAESVRVGLPGFLLAQPVAHANHWRQILVDGILDGLQHIGRVDKENAGIASNCAGPFQIEIRFAQVVVTEAGIL